MFKFDPNTGIIYYNGEELIMDDSNPTFKIYVDFLKNGGEVLPIDQ